MKVLVTTQPLSGHWHPLVPLARALEQAGHDVAVVTTPGFCATVAASGFRTSPVGVDESAEEHRERLERLEAIPGTERAGYMWAEVFAGVWAQRSLPDLLDYAGAWRPDLLIRGEVDFAGCVVAECLGIPHATVQATAYRPYLHDLIAPQLELLCASVGLALTSPLELLYHYLLLCPLPLSMQEFADLLPPTAHAIRYTGFSGASDDRLPDWVEQLADLPTIYATLGTVANRNTEILRAILDGLHGEQLNLIMTTGHDVDPALLGPQPTRVHIEHFIPQSMIFAYCDLVINHGGSGTVRDALKHGLPQVIIPVAADQHSNARRCVALGLARSIAPHERTAAAIRAATQEVLGDPVYRENARRLQLEMQALPGLEYAVGLLARLASERVPLKQQDA